MVNLEMAAIHAANVALGICDEQREHLRVRIASPEILPASGRCLTRKLTTRKRAAWSLPAVSCSHVSSEATMPDDSIAAFRKVVVR